MMPPLITVGSKPPASTRHATIDVVVVLPCVPAIAIALFSRISSASISARRTTGSRAVRAPRQLRIVFLDRRGDDDDVRAVDVALPRARPLTCDALLAQPLDVAALGRIGAAHRVAEIGQHLGDAAHADAADPDEVDRPDVARKLHESDVVPCLKTPAMRSTRSASRSAASVDPAPLAAAAMAASRAGAAASAAISWRQPIGREGILGQER